jgi:hypothetical protein
MNTSKVVYIMFLDTGMYSFTLIWNYNDSYILGSIMLLAAKELTEHFHVHQ